MPLAVTLTKVWWVGRKHGHHALSGLEDIDPRESLARRLRRSCSQPNTPDGANDQADQ